MRARLPKAGGFRESDQRSGLARAFSANRCHTDLINYFVTAFSPIQCRNRRRAVEKSRDVRSVTQLTVKSEGFFMRHPTSGLRLQLLDQIRSHVKISRAGTATKPFH